MTGRARNNPQFDRAQLAMLGEALGRDELRSMLSGLPAEIAAIMRRIETSLGQDDRDAASRACLVLIRSAASNFGAARLAAACRDFAGGIVRETSVPARLAELSDTIDKTLVALDLELGERCTKTNSRCSISRGSTSERGGLRAARRWSAGGIRPAACCLRCSSSRWPRKAA
jgi:HPt (histidine-containing phosphotransfer) domain-containing protein